MAWEEHEGLAEALKHMKRIEKRGLDEDNRE